MRSKGLPKYQRLLETLQNAILSGKYQPSGKLPSEAVLVRQFGTSRTTVGRALRQLQQKVWSNVALAQERTCARRHPVTGSRSSDY
jgi:DNA-binding GntR family transcriptional regulator